MMENVDNVIPIFVGYDPKEAAAYHTFCNSVIRRASVPVAFYPLAESILGLGRRDGSTDFVYSRFLVPWLMGFKGWALFVDGDMVCRADIAELWAQRDVWGKAVMVCKHDYKTKSPVKFLDNRNEDYPRKNWSSVVLWNCGHFTTQRLTPKYVREHDGAHLHRFQWLQDNQIGELPLDWNWLVGEYPPNPAAKLLHYTLGTPCFPEYATGDEAAIWHVENEIANHPT